MIQLGSKKTEWTGTELNPRSTPPPRSSQRRTDAPPPCTPLRNKSPPSPSPTRNNNRPPTPLPPPPRSEDPPRTSGNENGGNDDFVVNRVGYTRRDSLGILNLPRTLTEREIKIRYRQLARTYHPDKYNSTTDKMSKSEAQEHFKLLNNAYESLRT